MRNEEVAEDSVRVPEDAQIIVDFRDAVSYAAGHFPGSTSLDAPIDRVRFAELPAVASCPPMTVVAADADLAGVVELLASAGYTKLRAAIAASGVDWLHPSMEKGEQSKRLWLPSPTLLLPPVVAMQTSKEIIAIDFGCGCGRDAVHLASKGWCVIAIDNQQAFLTRLLIFAKRNRVSDRIHTVLYDLNASIAETLDMPCAGLWNASLFIFSRFFSPLWMGFVASNAQSGSIVAVHHFCEGATNRVGTKLPAKSCVSEDGLKDIFKAEFWDVIISERTFLPDCRPALNFLARRR